MELGDVVKLAIKVLNKSMDSTSLTSEKCKPAITCSNTCHFAFLLLSAVPPTECRRNAALAHCCEPCHFQKSNILCTFTFSLLCDLTNKHGCGQWSWQRCRWLMANWSTRFSIMRLWILLSKSLTLPSLRQIAREARRGRVLDDHGLGIV